MKAEKSQKVHLAKEALRSTNGASFKFEDLISAWHLVKALPDERSPLIDSVVTQVQAQVSTLGRPIDDLLLTSQTSGALHRLAISAQENFQVNAAGHPSILPQVRSESSSWG